MNTLATADAAYIAGLFDGEGSIGFRRSHGTSKTHSKTSYLRLRITNTHHEVLLWVAAVVGVGKVFTRPPSGKQRKPYHEWLLGRENVLKLLHQIFPYLRIKRLQAEIAFRFEASVANKSYRARLSPEVVALREGFRCEMTVANCGADASAYGPQGPSR